MVFAGWLNMIKSARKYGMMYMKQYGLMPISNESPISKQAIVSALHIGSFLLIRHFSYYSSIPPNCKISKRYFAVSPIKRNAALIHFA